MANLVIRELCFRKGEDQPVAVRDRVLPESVDMLNLRSFLAHRYGESLEPAWSGDKEAPVQVGWTARVPSEELVKLGLPTDKDLEMVLIPMAPDPETGQMYSVLLRVAEQRALFERLSREEGIPVTTVTMEERPWEPEEDLGPSEFEWTVAGPWEEVGVLGVDAATVAFADAAAIPPDWSLQPGLMNPDEHRVEDLRRIGLPMIAVNTTEDLDLPVEVLRDATGAGVAARMCFTNDVDMIPGRWIEVGDLEMSAGRCLACDPYMRGDFYRLEFELTAGRYITEVFEHFVPEGGTDILALRIRRDGVRLPSRQATIERHGP